MNIWLAAERRNGSSALTVPEFWIDILRPSFVTPADDLENSFLPCQGIPVETFAEMSQSGTYLGKAYAETCEVGLVPFHGAVLQQWTNGHQPFE